MLLGTQKKLKSKYEQCKKWLTLGESVSLK